MTYNFVDGLNNVIFNTVESLYFFFFTVLLIKLNLTIGLS